MEHFDNFKKVLENNELTETQQKVIAKYYLLLMRIRMTDHFFMRALKLGEELKGRFGLSEDSEVKRDVTNLGAMLGELTIKEAEKLRKYLETFVPMEGTLEGFLRDKFNLPNQGNQRTGLPQADIFIVGLRLLDIDEPEDFTLHPRQELSDGDVEELLKEYYEKNGYYFSRCKYSTEGYYVKKNGQEFSIFISNYTDEFDGSLMITVNNY